MAQFIFYTDEGITMAPNDEIVENLQILGFEFGNTENEAKQILLKENAWILQNGFHEDGIMCLKVMDSSYSENSLNHK